MRGERHFECREVSVAVQKWRRRQEKGTEEDGSVGGRHCDGFLTIAIACPLPVLLGRGAGVIKAKGLGEILPIR